MGWNNSGGYVRAESFSADASSGIRILASRMDTEFDDFASAMTLAWTRNGQNSPTTNIPMAGFRFTNAGAAASAEDYIRAKEIIRDVPIYCKDHGDLNHIQVSVQFYASVSAGQSPPDGAKLRVLAGENNGSKTSTSLTMYLHTPINTSAGGAPHVAPIWTRGRKYDPSSIRANYVYDFVYDASASGWHCLNPSPSYRAYAVKAKTVDSGGIVAGVASGSANIVISRNGAQLMAALQSSVSVSCSTSAQYLLLSATGLTSQTSGVSNFIMKHSIPITVKDAVSQSWSLQVQNYQFIAKADFNVAGTTVSAACTIRAAPFTAIFVEPLS